MKFSGKILLVLILLGLVLPFFIKDRSGRPLLSLARLRAHLLRAELTTLKELTRTAGERAHNLLPAAAPQPALVYRWQDDNGTTHFSDRPNPGGHSEAVIVNPQANLVPALPAPSPPLGPTGRGLLVPSPSLTSIPLEQLPQLIDQAQALQGSAARRNAKLERQSD